MSTVAADAVRRFIGRKYADQLTGIGVDPAAVPDDLDLLETGIIDSLGLIELIADLDTEFAVNIDFEDMDPDQLTIVGPFCRYVAERSGP